MSWLFLLVIFWKPIYYLIKSYKERSYLSDAKEWFVKLLELVKPDKG